MAGMTSLILLASAFADDGTTLHLPFDDDASVAEAQRSRSVRQTRQTTSRGGVTATRVTRTDGERRASKTVYSNGTHTVSTTRGHSSEAGMGRSMTTHTGPQGTSVRGRSATAPGVGRGRSSSPHGGTAKVVGPPAHAASHGVHTPVRVAGAPVVAHTPVRTTPTVVHNPVRTAPVVVHHTARSVHGHHGAPRAVIVHRTPRPVVVHGRSRTVVVAQPAPPPPPPVVERAPRERGLHREGSLALGLGMGSLVGGYADGGGGYGDLGFGLSGRYRPTAGLGLQLDVGHHRDTYSLLSERDQTQVAGSVALFAFPKDRVQPYALAGLSWTGRDIHDVVAFSDGSVAEIHTGASRFGPHAGLGVEFAFGRSIALDIEGRVIGALNGLPDDPSLPAQGLGKVALQFHF